MLEAHIESSLDSCDQKDWITDITATSSKISQRLYVTTLFYFFIQPPSYGIDRIGELVIGDSFILIFASNGC